MIVLDTHVWLWWINQDQTRGSVSVLDTMFIQTLLSPDLQVWCYRHI